MMAAISYVLAQILVLALAYSPAPYKAVSKVVIADEALQALTL